jgi:hypothetical protein
MEPAYAPNRSVYTSLRDHGLALLVCKRSISEPCDNRSGHVWGGIGACHFCGAVSPATELSSRSGAWRKYRASAIGHSARPFTDTRNPVDIGIWSKITVEEMIAKICQEECENSGDRA